MDSAAGSDIGSSSEDPESSADQEESVVEVNVCQTSSEEHATGAECSTSQLLSETQAVLQGGHAASPEKDHFAKPTIQFPEEFGSNCSQQLTQDVNPNQQHVACYQELGEPMRPSLTRRYSSPLSRGHDQFGHPPMTRSLSDQQPFHMRRSYADRLGSPFSGSEMVS